jgi:molybdopterin/thiamine biosynthesis adenylyltransferase
MTAPAGRRVRLKSSVDPVSGTDGALYLVRAGDDDLVVRDPEPADRALLEHLAHAEPTPRELADALGLPLTEVERKLADLTAAGVVTLAAASPALDREDAERYDRQLPYLADLGDAHDLQRHLAHARVVVIGCGGLGTWALAGLAGAGVRRLRIVDDDVVERSNLNRQVLFSPADLGRHKVQAAAAWLRAFDPRIEVDPVVGRVDGVSRAEAVVADADAVVLVADWPPYELTRWVNVACVRAGVPFATGGQNPPLLRVGPFYLAGRSACFACHEQRLRHDSADYDAYVARLRTALARGATLGPASGIVGTALAMEVLHLLVGAEPATAGAAHLLDLRTMRWRRQDITRDPSCPVCAGGQ